MKIADTKVADPPRMVVDIIDRWLDRPAGLPDGGYLVRVQNGVARLYTTPIEEAMPRHGWKQAANPEA